MEIIILVLLYYLSQNPDFTESVKPLMNQLKNSEQMLSFLGNLSSFTQTFSTFRQDSSKSNTEDKEKTKPSEEKTCPNDAKKEPQSPTKGIADDFIEKILESYLQKR